MTKVKIEGKSKFYYLMKTVLLILATCGLVSTACILFSFKTDFIINESLDLILYILVIYYYIHGYKSAHSNMLKYIFILFALIYAYNGLSYNTFNKAQSYSLIVASIFLAFMAGRLNKYNKNRWILLFCFLLLLGSTIYSTIHVNQEFVSYFSSTELIMYKWGFFNSVIQIACLSLAYLTRCYSHQKIGVDKDKEQTI